jgi:hypothetical protein
MICLSRLENEKRQFCESVSEEKVELKCPSIIK